jgi:hypothetical protein
LIFVLISISVTAEKSCCFATILNNFLQIKYISSGQICSRISNHMREIEKNEEKLLSAEKQFCYKTLSTCCLFPKWLIQIEKQTLKV